MMPLPDLLACLVSVLVFGAIFTPLELLVPRRRAPLLRPDLGCDALFLFGNFLLWTPLIGGALILVHATLIGLPINGLREAFAGQPAVVQIAEALLVSDLLTYWFHRWCHRSAFLWRFHRVHHSAEHLDWVAAYREHPVDNLLTRLVENLPLMLLGLPLAWIAGIAAFRGLWALFIHSNIAWTPPVWLGSVIGSPRLHQWHHHPTSGATCNFANLDPLMDRLFGTFRHPEADPDVIGDPNQPRRSYVGHMVHSFLSERDRQRSPLSE